MAVTKIWKIRSRLDRKINYIANPEKTTMKPDIEAVEYLKTHIAYQRKSNVRMSFKEKRIRS